MVDIDDIRHGHLIRRYKRFFAEVDSNEGLLLSHCANTGSMKSLLHPEQKALVSWVDNPKRKLKYTLQALQMPNGAWVCVNTQLPNAIVANAILAGKIAQFKNVVQIQREVKYGLENSKIDILLDQQGQSVYIEVKNVTLLENIPSGHCQFPDSVSTRGQKHIRELMEVVAKGHRGVLFFLVNRGDALSFGPAAHIDPIYANLLEEAIAAGVEVLIYKTQLQVNQDSLQISIDEALPYHI
jgi:sugar fermentation stimulation protein A